jgi:hypothetical protein
MHNELSEEVWPAYVGLSEKDDMRMIQWIRGEFPNVFHVTLETSIIQGACVKKYLNQSFSILSNLYTTP